MNRLSGFVVAVRWVMKFDGFGCTLAVFCGTLFYKPSVRINIHTPVPSNTRRYDVTMFTMQSLRAVPVFGVGVHTYGRFLSHPYQHWWVQRGHALGTEIWP